ncbi:MAG TPA: hypothetical protein VF607_13490, partial [Verrucomicrobiae bacterium]
EAHAWLDSNIRDGAKFRHAVGNNFQPGPAMDAVSYMDWLASQVGDPALSRRLTDQAAQTRGLIPISQYSFSAIGHIRDPGASLAYGGVEENMASARAQAEAELARFSTPATVLYQPTPGRTDLGKTHWSREANGLAAAPIATLLDHTLFSGDTNLIHQALLQVRALSKFHETVPRGAQTWEVPLHTPDILASAHLVHLYTRAFELTGDQTFLDEARYWAWTGVPFLYLTSTTGKPVGLYSTIPVLGATEFVAPNWMGLPVQWCGLVYADALRRLARNDTSGPWLKLADGITASSIQQIHPESQRDKQGLLPDSYDLINQTQNPVPINPATLMSQALPYYGAAPLYDFHVFRRHGIIVQAPGPISDAVESDKDVRFHVSSQIKPPWRVLITSIAGGPAPNITDFQPSLSPGSSSESRGNRIIITLKAPASLRWIK